MPQLLSALGGKNTTCTVELRDNVTVTRVRHASDMRATRVRHTCDTRVMALHSCVTHYYTRVQALAHTQAQTRLTATSTWALLISRAIYRTVALSTLVLMYSLAMDMQVRTRLAPTSTHTTKTRDLYVHV